MWMERRKWPDVANYRYQVVPVGEDEHGLWLRMDDGAPAFRRGQPLSVARRDGLRVVPWGRPWCAWFPRRSVSERSPESAWDLYVDIVDEPVRGDDGVITMVDLDLDVVRGLDGLVELVDEDDFAENQKLYSYPETVIDGALAASRSVLAAVEAGDPPFDGVAAVRWAASAGIEI